MGRKVGTKRKPRTISSAAQRLLDEAANFKETTAAWNRRMTLLSFSAQICGENIHPDEITRFAGMFEAFVLHGRVPPEPPADVVTLVTKVVKPGVEPPKQVPAANPAIGASASRTMRAIQSGFEEDTNVLGPHGPNY
jgi:hypothetical protein